MGLYAERVLLWDVQGIDGYIGAVEYAMAGTGYQRLADGHWCTEGLDSTLIPAPTLAARVVPSSMAEVVSTYLELMPGGYVALPTEGYPGMIINRYGKGLSFYIAGTIGEYYGEKSHPSLRQLVENIVCKLSSRILSTDAMCSVEFVLRSQEIDDARKRYILHVINMTGDMGRPLERIAPLFNVNVTVNLDTPGMKVSSVKQVSAAAGNNYALANAGNGPGGSDSIDIKNAKDDGSFDIIDLPFTQVGNEVIITIPRIDVYEAIVIE